MKNVFIINSPLQYLNAIEAIKYFNTDNNILLIKDSGTEWNQEQIKHLHSKFECLIGTTFYIVDQKGLIYSLEPKTKELLPILNDVDLLFSGSIGESLNQYLINVLNPNKVIYLDDGTKSVKQT